MGWMPTHLLLDFFGTLVDHSACATGLRYPRSHALLRDLGADLPYERFEPALFSTYADFERRCADDHREFSVTEVMTAFLTTALGGRPPGPDTVAAYVDTYIAEWNAGVRYLAGLDALVAKLRTEFRLAVVSNTHTPTLVPNHLAALGLSEAMDAVVLSVEVGRRKPHPAIYRAALERLGPHPRDAVFVGDTYEADFAGPRRAGMAAVLIDPAREAPVADADRIDSIFDLPGWLAAGRP
jgi:putative hydrolase of the HAD superfamily